MVGLPHFHPRSAPVHARQYHRFGFRGSRLCVDVRELRELDRRPVVGRLHSVVDRFEAIAERLDLGHPLGLGERRLERDRLDSGDATPRRLVVHELGRLLRAGSHVEHRQPRQIRLELLQLADRLGEVDLSSLDGDLRLGIGPRDCRLEADDLRLVAGSQLALLLEGEGRLLPLDPGATLGRARLRLGEKPLQLLQPTEALRDRHRNVGLCHVDSLDAGGGGCVVPHSLGSRINSASEGMWGHCHFAQPAKSLRI